MYAGSPRRATESARKADPQANIVALSGGGYDPKFYDPVIQAIGPETIDTLSVHFYGSREDQLPRYQKFAALQRQLNKPGWNTESGTICPTFFTTLPGFESPRQENYLDQLRQEVQAQTNISVQNYLTPLSVGQMEKWFHYFSRFTNTRPSQPTRWAGNGKEIMEFDGSLRANGAGLCVASHFMDGAKYQGAVPLDERLQMHVYQKGAGSVGFLWGRAEQVLTLGAVEGLTFYDVMGNRIEDKALKVTDSPIYFTSPSDAKASRTLLGGMKVTAG